MFIIPEQINYKALKVLPVDIMFSNIEWFTDSRDEFLLEVSRCGYEIMGPILNRDGFYYDRINKFAWHEYNGYGYTCSDLHKKFINDLQFIEYRILSEEEIKAIKTMLLYNLGNKQELRRYLYEHFLKNQIRQTYQRSFIFRKRTLGK